MGIARAPAAGVRAVRAGRAHARPLARRPRAPGSPSPARSSRQHGGAISARSGPAPGSEFVVRLPLDLSRPITDIRPPPAPPPPAPGVTRARVLVVDDNLDAADLFAGPSAPTATTSERLPTAPAAPGGRRVRPEVAFVDIGLPVMDGYSSPAACARPRQARGSSSSPSRATARTPTASAAAPRASTSTS